jgi:GxxExxY protein
MRRRGIAFECEVVVPVLYKEERIGEMRLDLLVGKRLIVELKSVDVLLPIHKAQVITYLMVTGMELGLLINFNLRAVKDGIKRVVLTAND